MCIHFAFASIRIIDYEVYGILLYIWDLAAVEFDTRLSHAEVEDPRIHVVLDLPVIKQLAYVVLEVRTY